MLPVEIHDRGRGPELKGTRLTVYDIIPYRLQGYTPEQLAEVFHTGTVAITPAHIEALYLYMDEHHDEVMAVHERIEARIAKGNPPEIEAKLRGAVRDSKRSWPRSNAGWQESGGER